VTSDFGGPEEQLTSNSAAATRHAPAFLTLTAEER
jgi:hypothetical protein